MVECLPTILEALGSITSTTKIKNKNKRRTKSIAFGEEIVAINIPLGMQTLTHTQNKT
jgi:hypothetical protein